MPSPVRALYLGPGGEECFGWLHPGTDSAGLGVVFCGSMGREDACFHRSLRHMALAAADRGLPALRFDYPGTGDSAGDELDPGRVPAWIASVSHAIDALKRETGVARVCLVGIRLGALLAATAASARTDVAGLVAIAPVVSGRTFVRELKALGSTDGSGRPAVDENGVLEAGGFAIAHDAQGALSALDLLKLEQLPAPRVLVVARDDIPPDMRWSVHLQQHGGVVENPEIPGYTAMLGGLSPHETLVPTDMVEATIRWMAALGDAVQAPRQAVTSQLPSGLKIHPRAGTAGKAVRERAWSMEGPGGPLVGILSTADDGVTAERPGVLLLPPGGDRRVGSSRLLVHAARRLAAQGHVVLRLDVGGLGDSPAHAGQRDNWPYNPAVLDDIAQVVEVMRRELGVSRCAVAGHCSGAYNALRTAIAGSRIDAVVMVNPLVFLANSDIDTLPVPRATIEAEYTARAYRRNLGDWARWKSILAQPHRAAAVARNLTRTTHQRFGNRWRDLARVAGWRFRNDFASELLDVAERGARLHFVFSSQDPGEIRLWALGGASLRRLVERGRVTITRNHRADHVYSRLVDRKELLDVLVGLLDGGPAEAIGTASVPALRSATAPAG